MRRCWVCQPLRPAARGSSPTSATSFASARARRTSRGCGSTPADIRPPSAHWPSSSDSSRLCSGGLDKNVEVWNMAALRDLRRVFLRERTIRWQVARGLRGSIYALAAAPDAPLLAIGGYGAMGSLGEIVLVNPIDGKLVKVLQGHRQTICSLAFSPDGKWLASMDTAGETRLWKRSDWSSRVIYHQDAETYGAEAAAMIARQAKLRPLAFLGSGHIVLPTFASNPGETRLRWRLVEINVADPTDFHALDTIHYGLVTALAASADGKWLASADAEGKLYLWDRAGNRGGSNRRITLAERHGCALAVLQPGRATSSSPARLPAKLLLFAAQPDHQHGVDRGAQSAGLGRGQPRDDPLTNGIHWPITSMPARSAPTASAWPSTAAIARANLCRVAGRRCDARGSARHRPADRQSGFRLEEPYYRVAFGRLVPGARLQRLRRLAGDLRHDAALAQHRTAQAGRLDFARLAQRRLDREAAKGRHSAALP